MESTPTGIYYTYIFTNATRDKFVTGYTADLAQTLRQFHQTGFRKVQLPEDRQDCFLLVFFERFEDRARALLESNVLEALSEQTLKRKIVGLNPEWKHLNLDLLRADTNSPDN
jgi:putative endonuclease